MRERKKVSWDTLGGQDQSCDLSENSKLLFVGSFQPVLSVLIGGLGPTSFYFILFFLGFSSDCHVN